MKLLDIKSCLREFIEGNFKTQTALGETTMDRSMDRGSIPLTSTIKIDNIVRCCLFLWLSKGIETLSIERVWGNRWFPTLSEAVYSSRGDRMACHPPRGDRVPYGERTGGAHRFPSPPPVNKKLEVGQYP